MKVSNEYIYLTNNNMINFEEMFVLPTRKKSSSEFEPTVLRGFYVFS